MLGGTETSNLADSQSQPGKILPTRAPEAAGTPRLRKMAEVKDHIAEELRPAHPTKILSINRDFPTVMIASVRNARG